MCSYKCNIRVYLSVCQIRGFAVHKAEAAAPVLGGGDVAGAGAGDAQLPAVRGAGLGRLPRHALLRLLRAHRHRAVRAQHALPTLHRYPNLLTSPSLASFPLYLKHLL